MTATLNPEPTETKTPVEQLGAIEPVKPRKKRQSKHDFKDGFGRVPARRHINGKGWVANTAVVEDSVYVGPRCEIFNYACVTGSVRLEGNSKISGRAVVSGNVLLKNQAHIFGAAVVRDRTSVYDSGRISGTAHVSGLSRIFGTASISDSAQLIGSTVNGSAAINGFALVIRSHVEGAAAVTGNCVIVNSNVSGNVRVEDFSQILGGSAARNTSTNSVLHIRNYAIITDNTHIWGPIVIQQHAVLVRCRVNIGYHAVETPLVIGNELVLHNQSFNRPNELLDFLSAIQNQQNRPQVSGNTWGPAQVTGFPARQISQPNFLESNSRPRRVQRLQEAGT